MRWLLTVMTIAGCSYRPGSIGSTDGPPADGPLPDSGEPVACVFAAAGADVDADPPFIGGTGGGVQRAVSCPMGELPIGLGFDVSEEGISLHADQIAMVNLRVRCGRLARDTDQVLSTTPMMAITRNAQGKNCGEYFPTVVAPEVTCPAGSILVGVHGNRPSTTLYNTVSIACAAIQLDGTLGAVSILDVVDTGDENNQPMISRCPSGTAITGFAVQTGCGHDQLKPRCARITCN